MTTNIIKRGKSFERGLIWSCRADDKLGQHSKPSIPEEMRVPSSSLPTHCADLCCKKGDTHPGDTKPKENKILHTDPAITAQMCCVCVTVFTPGLNRKARAGRERSDQATPKHVLGSRNKTQPWMERSREGTWQNKCSGELQAA